MKKKCVAVLQCSKVSKQQRQPTASNLILQQVSTNSIGHAYGGGERIWSDKNIEISSEIEFVKYKH